MRSTFSFCRYGLIPFFALLVAGCGGSSAPDLPDPVPTTGKVLLDKEPLGNAVIYFVPDGTGMGQGATGVTSASGEFKLTTSIDGETKEGAIPGNYKVAVSRMIDPQGKVIVLKPDTPPADMAARESLPPKYSDPVQTTLKATVGESGGNFDFTVKLK